MQADTFLQALHAFAAECFRLGLPPPTHIEMGERDEMSTVFRVQLPAGACVVRASVASQVGFELGQLHERVMSELSAPQPPDEPDFAAAVQTATEELRHAYESTLESAIGRCMMLGFTPDRVQVEQGYPFGSKEHPVAIVDKAGAALACIYLQESLDPPEIQVVRVFSEAVLEKVKARLGAVEG